MRVIDYQQIDMTDAEYEYYQQLVTKCTDEENGVDGKDYFRGVFETNQEGQIILIKTDKSVPWTVLFFIQQVMINQRMRVNDKLIQENRKLLDRLARLEKQLNPEEER